MMAVTNKTEKHNLVNSHTQNQRTTNLGILSEWPVHLGGQGRSKGESTWRGVRGGTAETHRAVI